MRKIFVLYSLKQKLLPSIYKTKSIVNKHMNNNKSLQYQEFDNEEHAKTFVEKFSLEVKNKSIFLLSEQDVNGIVESIVGKKEEMGKCVDMGMGESESSGVNNSVSNNNSSKAVDGGSNKTKKKSSPSSTSTAEEMSKAKKKKTEGEIKKEVINTEPEWTVLPNGYAFRNNRKSPESGGMSNNINNNNYNNININETNQIPQTQQQQLKQEEKQRHQEEKEENEYHYKQQLKQRYQELKELRSITKSNFISKNELKKNKNKDNKSNGNNGDEFLFNKATAAETIKAEDIETTEQQEQEQELTEEVKLMSEEESINSNNSNIVTNIVDNNKLHQEKVEIVLNYDDIHEVDYSNNDLELKQEMKQEQEPKQKEQEEQEQSQIEEPTREEQSEDRYKEKTKRKKHTKELADEKIHWGGELIKESETIMEKMEIEMEMEMEQQEKQEQEQQPEQEQIASHKVDELQEKEIKEPVVMEEKMKVIFKESSKEQEQEQEQEKIQESVNYIKPHPYNKEHLKNVINQRLLAQTQNDNTHEQELSNSQSMATEQELKEQQELETQQQQESEEFAIYPSLVLNQSPGFAIGSYVIKSTKTNRILKQETIKLGQYRKEEANLLTLAFTLSSMGRFVNGNDSGNGYNVKNNSNLNNNFNNNNNNNNNNRIRLHISKEMHQSINKEYKLDKKLKQTQEFTQSIQEQVKSRIEYVY